MEFLPLVTEAKERERRDKKSKRRENEWIEREGDERITSRPI
jgi:hypothetical protein